MAAERKHRQQTGGAQPSLPVLNQQTTLGSHRLQTETLTPIPEVAVTLGVEATLVLEEIPGKTQLEDTQLVEVTTTNLEEPITQTKTLQGAIQERVVTPNNLEEAIIQTKTLQEAIQELAVTHNNLEEPVIQTRTQQAGTLRLEGIQLLEGTRTNPAEAVIQTSIPGVIQQQVDIRLLGVTPTQDGGVVVIQSEQEALDRAGVLRDPTLEVILVVVLEVTQIGIPTIRSLVLAMV